MGLLRLIPLTLSLALGGPAASAQDAPSPGPTAVMHVRSAEDALSLRAAIIRDVWKADALPKDTRVGVESGAPRLDARNVRESRTLVTTMEFGLESRTFLYLADTFSGCLFIYHSGHDEPVTDDLKSSLWKPVIEGGCDLLYVAMPLAHHNPRPVVASRFGPLLLKSHDAFALLQDETFNPLKFFLQPVLASLNEAEARRSGYRFVAMAGLSGGGWTTTLYAALDPRISLSLPVSGTLPISLRTFADPNIGDWEQYAASIYGYLDYIDLYALGTLPARAQLQLLTAKDPCCSRGAGASIYERPVSELVRSWGGAFSLVVDEEGRKHEVSPRHVRAMLAALASASGIAFAAPAPAPNPCDSDAAVALERPFRHEAGRAFQAMLPALAAEADSNEAPRRSPALLCEDMKPLGPAHSQHDAVRKLGEGAFSHWTDYLLFSPSDNSDPNQNRRRYSLVMQRR